MAPDISDAVIAATPTESFPDGDYMLVFYDLSLTGFRLIDEIIDIGAYCNSKDKFSAAIMPYCDLPPNLQNLYGMRVVTIGGKYRELKDCVRNAIIPSRTEYSGLNEFLGWLKKVKGEKEGVILVGCDGRKSNAVHLVQAYMRYGMFEAFTEIVKGFANLNDSEHEFKSCRKFITTSVGEHQLCLDAAVKRAVYLEKAYLIQSKEKELKFESLKSVIFSPSSAQAELNKIKEYVSKEANLKPIFSYYFGPRTRMGVRSYAAKLRRLLVDADLEFASLAETFARKGGKDGVREMITESVKGKPEEIEVLIDIISTHFDPQMQRKDMPSLVRNGGNPDNRLDRGEKYRRRSQSQKNRSRSFHQKKVSIADQEQTSVKQPCEVKVSDAVDALGENVAKLALEA